MTGWVDFQLMPGLLQYLPLWLTHCRLHRPVARGATWTALQRNNGSSNSHDFVSSENESSTTNCWLCMSFHSDFSFNSVRYVQYDYFMKYTHLTWMWDRLFQFKCIPCDIATLKEIQYQTCSACRHCWKRCKDDLQNVKAYLFVFCVCTLGVMYYAPEQFLKW